MHNLSSVLLTVLLACLSYLFFTHPTYRQDCLSPTAQLDHWFNKELPRIQTRMHSLTDPLTPTSKLWVIDECLVWLGKVLTEEEIQEWRSKSNFQGHYVSSQLKNTCSLFAEIDSIKVNYSSCNMDTVLQTLLSQIDNHLSQLQFWMKVWHLCQIDSHMEICRISLLKK